MSSRLFLPVRKARHGDEPRRTSLHFGFLIALFIGLSFGFSSPATAQPDSTRRAILRAKGLPPTHTPRRAVIRALAVPGWGQFYNRQYYKMPFVYAGLAGLGAAIVVSNNRYLLYRHATLYKQNEGTTPNPYAQYEDEYNTLRARIGGEIRANVLRQQRDKFRRYRDLSIVGVGLFYALSVLDAYVSAHLLTFDVDQNLSIRTYPAAQGITARVRWRF